MADCKVPSNRRCRSGYVVIARRICKEEDRDYQDAKNAERRADVFAKTSSRSGHRATVKAHFSQVASIGQGVENGAPGFFPLSLACIKL
jgi:hypothetical protein